jgi:hypothetical protein
VTRRSHFIGTCSGQLCIKPRSNLLQVFWAGGVVTAIGQARARIAAAQRARWAKVRQKSKVAPIRRKRTLSAAARRKIPAAQKAR